MMPEQLKQRREVALAPLHLLPRELLAEVVNWTIFPTATIRNRQQQTAAEAASPPRSDGDASPAVAEIVPLPVSDVYDSYVCSRLRRMPPTYEYVI